MLELNDNMLKLARMHESLLKISVENREENLEKYKDIVMEIDKQAFASLLDMINQVNDHNQTLEDELQFMEMISDCYNQLYELQLGFKNVCELYDDNELKLSDLSQINIDYINKRKNIIKGYLINLKNIDVNNKKLEKLNNDLLEEEKKKNNFIQRLLEYEDILRSNFETAEGRLVVDGNLQYVSVVSEYKELDYDFKFLLDNNDVLKELLIKVSGEREELDEKYRTAEICYNSNPSVSSKRIFDDISVEFLNVKYKLTMLKILELLSYRYNSYELFKEKRENLLDLIKYRVECLKKMGKHVSIDPFARTRISEQIDSMSVMLDNSKKIKVITKEISELSNFVDEMTNHNKDYKNELDVIENLIIDTVIIEDEILEEEPEDIYFITEVAENVLDNQVVSLKDVSNSFNISAVREKTSVVINRVNQMMFGHVENSDSEKEIDVVNPELVIVSQPLNVLDNFVEEQNEKFDEVVVSDAFLDIPILNSELIVEESKNDKIEDNPFDIADVIMFEEMAEKKEDNGEKTDLTDNNHSIFETLDPFAPMPLFVERADEDEELNVFKGILNIDREEEDFPLEDDLEDEKEDVFWVVQSEDDDNVYESENVEDTKTKKLIA